MAIKLGCGQITWSADTPEDKILEDIRESGYEGAPWRWKLVQGDRDNARSAEAIRSVLSRHNLQPAPAYFWGNFWDTDRLHETVAEARRYAEVSAALGLHELYVAAGGGDKLMASGRTRLQAAGHVTPQDALSEAESEQFADGLQVTAAATLEYGVHCCYHNHVGTVIETEEEIEDLLGRVDESVSLGPDTGHLAWAGIDVVAFCERHADRIRTMHIKDINGAIRDQGRHAGWDYDTFSENGIFTELGTGCVDFTSMFSVLAKTEFSGWLIAETDVTQLSSPLESATVSREYLRRFGL